MILWGILSSVTVEYFAVKTFGYPSEYLMNPTGKSWWKLFLRYSFNICKDEYAPFDEKKVWTWCILFALSYISFLAFVKFYRRFTLENYMIMLTEKRAENENSVGYKPNQIIEF